MRSNKAKSGGAIAHIDIFGEISSMQTPDAGAYGIISLAGVHQQVKDAGGADGISELVVHINSPGGEVSEGFAIYNYITSLGVPVTTIADGMVASIASVIFLAGSTRKAYTNTDFMIHNPWTMAVGDANQLESYVEDLRRVERQLLDFYVKATGSDRDTIEVMMADETHLTAEQLLELKFATEVVDPVKAFAKFSPTNNKTIMKKLNKVGKFFAEAWTELKRLGVPLNEMVMTADGKELEIEMGDATEVQVGQSVMMEGAPAPDGEYVLENGMTIMVVAGVISEVMSGEAPAETPEVSALRKEITSLRAELANLKSANEAIEKEATEIVAHLKTLNTRYAPPRRFGAQVSSESVTSNATPSKEDIKARINQLRKK